MLRFDAPTHCDKLSVSLCVFAPVSRVRRLKPNVPQERALSWREMSLQDGILRCSPAWHRAHLESGTPGPQDPVCRCPTLCPPGGATRLSLSRFLSGMLCP